MKRVLILIFILAFYLSTSAQKDSTQRSSTTILFGDGKIVDNSPRYKYNAIKICFLDFLGGKYGLYYEKKLTNGFGAELGGGVTGRNIVGNGLREVLFEDDKNQNSSTFSSEYDITDHDYDFKSREATIGYFITLIPKWYYYQDKGLDGNYFALNFQFRRHNFDAYGLDPYYSYQGILSYNKNVTVTKEFEYNYVAGLAWGKQLQTGIVTFDFLLSTGAVYITGEKRDIGLVVPADPALDPYATVAEKSRKVSTMALHLEVAIKFGFCWK